MTQLTHKDTVLLSGIFTAIRNKSDSELQPTPTRKAVTTGKTIWQRLIARPCDEV